MSGSSHDETVRILTKYFVNTALDNEWLRTELSKTKKQRDEYAIQLDTYEDMMGENADDSE